MFDAISRALDSWLVMGGLVVGLVLLVVLMFYLRNKQSDE